MRAYDFIINKKFLEHELIENVYYFRIDFLKFIEDNRSFTTDEFIKNIQNEINLFSENFDKIIESFKDIGLEFEIENPQIWQNSYKNLVLSKKGLIKNIEDFKKFLEDFNQIKKNLLKEDIFIRLINYIK